ncbi:MAG: FtsX-like permease family protein [Chloroflexi bacterium]|nr:FtsX-like permease family protein [Chloroflexota bacterium]
MSRAAFYLRTAVNNLRRGGQRIWIALLCISFGVMSLVAMATLSGAIERMLVLQPRDQIGADISMVRANDETITPAQSARLQELQQAGAIEGYTLLAYTSSLAFHKPGSGELSFVSAGLGIDPLAYPPAGQLTIGEPANTGLATLLQGEGDILVTRDLAIDHDLAVGDRLILADTTVGATLECQVRGIIADTPNHQGSKIYYALPSAARLANTPQVLNTALVTAGDPPVLARILEEEGWVPYLATELIRSEAGVQQIFEITLKGAGMLGLLVGGVGIANTMQVLLRRRRREIAIWKTLGYRSGHLYVLFGLEAALLGAAGSLLGAGLGVAVSYALTDLFSQTSTMLITWAFSPAITFTGFWVGLATTVIFAMLAIVRTGQVRPSSLLRNEPTPAAETSWLHGAGLAGLLAIPLLAVTSLVMGSLLSGVSVLVFALAGLVCLGGLMVLLMKATTRLLPVRGLPLVNMARNNLRRRGLSLVYAMVALFAGIFSLGLGTVATQSAHQAIGERSIQLSGSNITLLAAADQESAIRQAIQAYPLVSSSSGYQAAAQSIHTADGSVALPPALIGRSGEQLSDFEVNGAPWGSRPDGVYTAAAYGLPAGSQVEVHLWDGSRRSFEVVGSYAVDYARFSPLPDLGLLMSTHLLQETAAPQTVQYFLEAPAGQIQATSAALGQALPQATVINLPAYTARFTQNYQDLYIFAVAMASLALLAGVLLVANSVSLAMLDRRYEIGVLKAMGYTRRHVLTTLVVEYTLVGLIASAAGLAVIQILLWGVARANALAGGILQLSPAAAVFIGLAGVGLTLLTVLGVTWGPTHVSPAVVLNDRE